LSLQLPLSGGNEKKIGFLWKKSGNVSIDACIPKSGYSPGLHKLSNNQIKSFTENKRKNSDSSYILTKRAL